MTNNLILKLKEYNLPTEGEYLLSIKTGGIYAAGTKIIHINVVNTRKNRYYHVDGKVMNKQALDLYLSNLRAEVLEIIQ